jgi:cation-transporting ATPase E
MPNAGRYVPGFLRRSLAFAVPAGLVIAAAVLAVNVAAALAGAAPDVTRTGSVLAVRSRPLNGWRLLVIAAMVTGLSMLLTLPAATGFFELPGLPPDLLAVSLGVATAGSAAIEVLGRWHRRRYCGQP